jgi:hypothetical protein
MGEVLYLSETDDRAFPVVPGLDRFRAQVLGETGGGGGMTTRTRVMLSMLGLGLEQTTTWLGQTRPSPGEFRRWIMQMAGLPSPDALARYIALVRGEPIPTAVKDRLDAIDRMPPVLDERELTRWEYDGYAILDNAIAPAEVMALAHLVWKLAEARQDVPETWYAARPQGIMLQHFQSPQQDVARYSARIHKAFAQLWGTADLWPSIDRLGFSPPVTDAAPFRASPLHWDCSLHRPVPYGMFGVLYLTDTAAEQGAFRLVPGFHRRLDAWLDDLGEQDPRSLDLEDEAVPIAGRAGDLIICRHDLPHGASPNRAGSPRLVQYLSMFPPWFEEQSVWR